MAGAGGSFGIYFDQIPYENDGHLLAFKLDGEAAMPAMVMKKEGKVADIKVADLSGADIDEGQGLYNTHCLVCHGLKARSSGLLPDLRFASKETHESWSAIVIGGMKKDTGMASFADVLSVGEADKIHAYVIQQALHEPGFMQSIVETVAPLVCIPPTWLAN